MIDLLLGYTAIMGSLIGLGWTYSELLNRGHHSRIAFVWYDLWVGAYYDRTKRLFYVVPFPTIVFIFDWKKP